MKQPLWLCCPILLLAFTPAETKKKTILSISKKYFPENYQVLKEYGETEINFQAPGKKIKEYLFEIPTVVHEGYHHFMGIHSSYYDSMVRYRINDALYFDVPFFKTFPSIELNSIVPKEWQKKISRYNVYIDSKVTLLVTQQFGLLGLMEESCAYYQSMKTSLALFDFLKDTYGWKSTDVWVEYLGEIGSYRYALTEFMLFTSWYLQYAKQKHGDVYKAIAINKGLKKLFSFLVKSDAEFSEIYNRQREEIKLQLGDKVAFDDEYIFDTKTNMGKGLFNRDLASLQKLLAEPQHNILSVLKDQQAPLKAK